MKIVTLCENRLEPCFQLKASHGISLFIETDDYKILYDVGQDNVYFENAKLLGVDIESADAIVISHGHLDHAGGLKYLKDLNKVIISAESFKDKVRLNNGKEMDIGISVKLTQFQYLGKSINKSFKIHEGIWCIANVNLTSQYQCMEKGLCEKDEDGVVREDSFSDELNLAIETSDGLYVISGCAHKGVINILREAQEVTGVNKIHTFIGGMHLNFANEKQIQNVLLELKKFNISRYVVGHCTGFEAITMMKAIMGTETEIVNNYVGYCFN